MVSVALCADDFSNKISALPTKPDDYVAPARTFIAIPNAIYGYDYPPPTSPSYMLVSLQIGDSFLDNSGRPLNVLPCPPVLLSLATGHRRTLIIDAQWHKKDIIPLCNLPYKTPTPTTERRL